jgi:hypothetical protein
VRMASPTDVVVMKTLAARSKDVDDIVGIIRARPSGLDLDDARHLLRELEAMLDQSDLVTTLDAAIARAKRR